MTKTKKKRQREMTGHIAARLALRLAIHHAIAAVVENEGPDYAREAHAAARQKIEAAVRRERNAPVRDIAQLRDAVVKAVPQPHRDDVFAALRNLDDAVDEDNMVWRDINYFIGVAVGQALRGEESWDFVSFGDAVPSPRQRRKQKHR